MNIIRDEELNGLMMTPLLIEWNVRRCNVKDCKERPTTIITGAHPEAPVIGFCENHYQSAVASGHIDCTLVFDDFDAFACKKETKHETQ